MENHECEHTENFKQDAIGFFSKRQDGKTPDVKWYRGDILKCRYCPAMIFLPYSFELNSVPVDFATADELEAVNF